MDWLLSLIEAEWSGHLIDSFIKTSLILGLGLLIYWRSRKASASVRHFVLSLTLVGVLLLPIISAMIPHWEVSPLPRTADFFQRTEQRFTQPEIAAAPSAGGPRERMENVSLPAEMAESSRPWTWWVLPVWLCGAVLVGLRLCAGLGWAWWLRRNATPFSPDQRPLRDILERCAGQAGIRQRVSLMQSGRIGTPIVVGLIRPVIILPTETEEWSEDRLQAVLLHELAHVKRRDPVLALISQLAAALHWFNPLVWLTVRQLQIEREKACDDRVLSAGTNDIGYARHLLQIGRRVNSNRWLAPLEPALASQNDLEGRLMDILNTKRNRGRVGIGRMLLIGLLAALFIVPMAGITGKALDTQLDGVSTDDEAAIRGMLAEFYENLRVGEDFRYIRETFLTSDYFENDDLTLENLDEHTKREAFDNTLTLIHDHHAYGNLAARPEINSIRREGDLYVLSLRTDIVAQGFKVSEEKHDNGDITIRAERDPVTGEAIEVERSLTNDLQHEVFLRKEDGRFKIARYDDGLAIMQMDTDNPYGPIFLIWMDDMGGAVTPYGPFIAKIIPAEIMGQQSTNIRFESEEQ